MRKMPRFCKEPKTFSRGILLILNSFVSLPLGFSFALSCSRFFFLNCRLLPLLSHPLTRDRITPSHSRSLYVLSICARSLRRNYLSCLLSAPSKKKKECHTEHIKKGRAEVQLYVQKNRERYT